MLYEEDGSILNLDINSSFIIGSGVYGSVYRIDRDACIKLFKPTKELGLIERNIDYLRSIRSDIDSHNIYDIYTKVYNDDGFIGYIMKYYENKDLMDFSKRYLFENYESIRSLFQRLGSCGIYLSDLHKNNLLVTDEGLILIDCDFIGKTFDTCKAYYTGMSLFNQAIKELFLKYGVINGLNIEEIMSLYNEFNYYKNRYDCDEKILSR